MLYKSLPAVNVVAVRLFVAVTPPVTITVTDTLYVVSSSRPDNVYSVRYVYLVVIPLTELLKQPVLLMLM